MDHNGKADQLSLILEMSNVLFNVLLKLLTFALSVIKFLLNFAIKGYQRLKMQQEKSMEQRFLDHRTQGFRYIQQALALDESKLDKTDDEKNRIVKLYKKGVGEFDAGLRLPTYSHWSSDTSKFRAEMMKNLQKIKGRITDLSVVESTTPKLCDRKPVVIPKTVVKRTPKQKPTDFVSPSNSKNYPPSKVQRTETTKEKIRGIKDIDSKFVTMISNEIVHELTDVSFESIAGQDSAKQALQEMVILPSIRPDLFNGLRQPCRGLLLFGPPGNGKTLLAKAVAAESKMTFFNISASSLTSKWIGDGEKLVRALFSVARKLQPSIIFVDEIDSLLCQRNDTEHEASRRLKTEFFLQFDGLSTKSGDQVVVIGATNRPQELDDAIIRRLTKRIYVQLPDENSRVVVLEKLLENQEHSLSKSELLMLAKRTDGYSGCDLTALSKEAAMIAIRELGVEQLKKVKSLRKLNMNDFLRSLNSVRRSVPQESLSLYQEWNARFGDVS